jgi:hypothetical protein
LIHKTEETDMSMVRRIFISSFVFVVLISSPVWAGEITGLYSCTGADPAGANYDGTVVISRRGEAYRVEWTIAGQKYAGIGLLSDGVLSATWVTRNTNSGGVVAYKVKENGQLVGKWVDTSGSRIISEILTPVR